MKRKLPKQLAFNRVSGWGGKRLGAGRSNQSGQVNHMKRPTVNLKAPIHITLRLIKRIPSLRNKNLFKEFKESVKRAQKQGLYVVHFSVQSNHIHFIAEAKSNTALALGMRALVGRFAKIIRSYTYSKRATELHDKNGKIGKKGSVFNGRYHLHVLKTPREVKNALEYVLLNLSKHQKLIEYIDHFSSGHFFKQWPKLLGRRYGALIKNDAEFFKEQYILRARDPSGLDEVLSAPQSWLGRVGWMKACL